MIPYLVALSITLAVEVPIVLWLSSRGVGRSIVADAFLLNLLTHPLGYLAVTWGLVSFGAAECAIVGVEAAGYALVSGLSGWRSVGVALGANAVTIALSFTL